MTSSQLLLTSVFLLVASLFFGGWLTTRARTEPLGFWPLAWSALFVAGGVRLTPLPNEIEVGFGILFAAFMLAGSLQYAGRALPRQFVVASAAFAVLATVVSFTSLTAPARTVAVAFQLSAIVYSALLVHRVVQRENRAWFHQIIGPGLGVIAIIIVTDYLGVSRPMC